MKKFENPIMNISMFDASVAMGDSAVGKAITAITGKYTEGSDVKIDVVSWGNDAQWTL